MNLSLQNYVNSEELYLDGANLDCNVINSNYKRIILCNMKYDQLSESVWKHILKNVETLKFKYCTALSLVDFNRIYFYSHTTLRRLIIYGTFRPLEYGFHMNAYLRLLWLPSSTVTHVELIKVHLVDTDKIINFLNLFRNLEHLVILSNYTVNIWGFMTILLSQQYPHRYFNIKTLVFHDFINNYNGGTFAKFNDLFEHMTSSHRCTKLKLEHFGCCVDAFSFNPTLEEFFKKYSGIKVLEIFWIVGYTFLVKFLRDLFKHAKNLNVVIIHFEDGTDKVFSRDDMRQINESQLVLETKK